MAAPTKLGQSALDAQLQYIVDNAITLRLVKNFTRAMTHANVVTNTIALYTISGGDIFGVIGNDTSGTGDADAPNRRLPVNAQLLADATGTNADANELSLVLTDAAEVLANTDETTNRAVAVSDAITTFAWYIQASQPVQVA